MFCFIGQNQLNVNFSDKLLKESIDFLTYYYSYNKSNDLFLELDIKEFSEKKEKFNYVLKERFYYEDIETMSSGKFYRSNNVIITVDNKDTCYIDTELFSISDSLASFYKENNLHNLESPYPRSATWSTLFIDYKNGVLSGNFNGATSIKFNRFQVSD